MEAMTRQFSPNLLSQGRARLHVGDGTLIAPDKQEAVLADQIANYNSSAGHINIDNPGALIVELSEVQSISYVRFLLWDNCGPTKQQPSRRRYTYRLMYTESYDPSGSEWVVLYENTQNPSNGWQEFYFEDTPRNISAIKIQCFQNTTPSAHRTGTQFVSVQAFAHPTESVIEMLKEKRSEMEGLFAPPVPGIVKNRVILGGGQEHLKTMVQAEINGAITRYIHALRDEVDDDGDREMLADMETNLINENKNSDIERQINLFYGSILRPIDEAETRVQRSFKWIGRFALGVMIIDMLLDIVSLF